MWYAKDNGHAFLFELGAFISKSVVVLLEARLGAGGGVSSPRHMESAFPTFQSDAQSSMAASTAAVGSGAAAARVGMKQQIADMEMAAAETAAALRAAVERAAADKEELAGLIGAMENKLMAEIERLREENNNHFAALRAGARYQTFFLIEINLFVEYSCWRQPYAKRVAMTLAG